LQCSPALFMPIYRLCLWDISFNEPAAYGLGKESVMTKHNAETGTNEERSQECARLLL
jgi:hypothetical protein